jgi:hypothetical protein
MARVFTPEPGGFGANALFMGVGEEIHLGNYIREASYHFTNNSTIQF